MKSFRDLGRSEPQRLEELLDLARRLEAPEPKALEGKVSRSCS
jgi:hypothetical protein